jgi:CDP-4-dehydro-6-deoxyglucose reductase
MIKETALPKTSYSDGAAPLPQIILTRLEALNTTLAQTKSALNASEDLIQGTLTRLQGLINADSPAGREQIEGLKSWLEQGLASRPDHPDKRARLFAKDAFLKVVAASVKVIPSGHEFFVDGTESILDASLRAGLHFNYGCASGHCGSCKARVIKGEVWKIRDHDYLLSSNERNMGYMLSCCNTAVTDVVLEAAEAFSPSDLPSQEIRANLRKVLPLSEDQVRVLVQTPRTQTLRFLAGQKARLTLEDGQSRELHIASCPCDGRNLEFLVRRRDSDPFAASIFSRQAQPETLTLQGPTGDFVLYDDSTAPILLLALGDGIGPIKSLAEHAISVDQAERFHLYWLGAPGEENHINRLCRSWRDSLDNFHYRALEDGDVTDAIKRIRTDLPDLQRFNLYVAGPRDQLEQAEQQLRGLGLGESQLRFEVLP